MKKEVVAKYVKAGAAILACAGVVVSPDQQEVIMSGFLIIYSIISVIQGKIKASRQ